MPRSQEHIQQSSAKSNHANLVRKRSLRNKDDFGGMLGVVVVAVVVERWHG